MESTHAFKLSFAILVRLMGGACPNPMFLIANVNGIFNEKLDITIQNKRACRKANYRA